MNLRGVIYTLWQNMGSDLSKKLLGLKCDNVDFISNYFREDDGESRGG